MKNVLTDAEVELIRNLYEADRYKLRKERFWTPQRLAEKFECHRDTIQKYVAYRRRGRCERAFRGRQKDLGLSHT